MWMSALVTALDRFANVSFQPRIQWFPLPGTVNGGTAPFGPHLIRCGMPLWRGGAWPGPPGLGALTEQPGTEGIVPFLTTPIVCTRTPSHWPVAAWGALPVGASLEVK